MNAPILLLDMDDVMNMQVDVVLEEVQKRTHIAIDKEAMTQWDLRALVPAPALTVMQELWNRKGFYRHLPPQAGAIEGTHRLMEHYQVYFVTAAFKNAMEDKFEWLEDHFPGVPIEQHFIPTHAKGLLYGDIIIDDGPHNIMNSRASRKIIFDQPWNRSILGTNVQRVHDWQEITDLLLQDSSSISLSKNNGIVV